MHGGLAVAPRGLPWTDDPMEYLFAQMYIYIHVYMYVGCLGERWKMNWNWKVPFWWTLGLSGQALYLDP